jgi:ribonuclease HI
MERHSLKENPEMFWYQIDREKMIHVVTDGGTNQNPRPTGWGAVVRQGENFTMLWNHFYHATNNTMELRVGMEALRYVPAEMTV